jgi:exodeoxyribonuclease-5
MTTDKQLTREDLSPDQREVYEAIIRWCHGSLGERYGNSMLLTIGGFAGVGKSSLLGVFAAETKLRVAYCAFTGRAASVLQRKLRAAGCNAAVTTIHRLIYLPVIDSKTEEVLGWKKRQHLDGIDLIVIDEASMVSGKMLDDLKIYGKPILAVGDHGQLPPVMDSGDLMKNPDLRLEKIHRQAESSPIIQFSKVVRETGCLDRRLADGDKIRFASRRDIESVLADAYRFVDPSWELVSYAYQEPGYALMFFKRQRKENT